jgi:hypothetical protein
MACPSKYPRELCERAVRMVGEVRPDDPSEYQAMTAMPQMLGIGSPETVRTGCAVTRSTPASGTAACERDLEGGFGLLRGRPRPATEAVVAFIQGAQGPY